jgi:hypothetical protein
VNDDVPESKNRRRIREYDRSLALAREALERLREVHRLQRFANEGRAEIRAAIAAIEAIERLNREGCL